MLLNRFEKSCCSYVIQLTALSCCIPTKKRSVWGTTKIRGGGKYVCGGVHLEEIVPIFILRVPCVCPACVPCVYSCIACVYVVCTLCVNLIKHNVTFECYQGGVHLKAI